MGSQKSKGKKFSGQATRYGMEAGRYATELFGGTRPARESFYQTWEDMMGGELPGGAFPQMYEAGRAPIEAQYGRARENVMGMLPEGGRLEEALTDVEIARSQGLQSVVADLLGDEIMRMYGAAFGVPGTAMQSMLGLSQQGVQTAQAGAQGAMGMGQACCFNFLEAEGEIHSAVKRYRDECYPKDGIVGRGYLWTASVFVPLMRNHPYFKKLIRLIMTRPITLASQWHYGENRYGFIFWPIGKAWVYFWRLLGNWR